MNTERSTPAPHHGSGFIGITAQLAKARDAQKGPKWIFESGKSKTSRTESGSSPSRRKPIGIVERLGGFLGA